MDKQAVLEKSKDSSTNDNEQDQVASEKSTLKQKRVDHDCAVPLDCAD
jgi:hypothetical protein